MYTFISLIGVYYTLLFYLQTKFTKILEKPVKYYDGGTLGRSPSGHEPTCYFTLPRHFVSNTELLKIPIKYPLEFYQKDKKHSGKFL